jgi:hypothetical protein
MQPLTVVKIEIVDFFIAVWTGGSRLLKSAVAIKGATLLNIAPSREKLALDGVRNFWNLAGHNRRACAWRT